MEIMSTSIKEIAKALSFAQSKIKSVKKTKDGYGYKYAELSDCLELIKEPLTESELAITQLSSFENGQNVLTTLLIHTSGEWIKSSFPLKPQVVGKTNEMQALGSGITYLRRYALCAMLGIAQEDDDAESFSNYKNDVDRKPIKFSVNNLAKKLQEMCLNNNISVRDFTSYFQISSSVPETIENALANFEDYLNNFRENQIAVEA